MSAPSPSAAAPSAPHRLRKELGLLDVYAISTGAMFSSGFFLLPGLAAAQTGPSVALAYVVAGFLIMPAMFCVAELATAMPRAGGAYYFLDRSLGPLVGSVGGVGTWFALVLKSAFALVGMGAYLSLYFDIPVRVLAVLLTVAFAVVNLVGAKETGALQRWLVATLLVIMALFIAIGVAEVGSGGPGAVLAERFTPFMPFGVAEFFSTVGFVFVSYAGLTKVASVAEEVRDPHRNIPRGMMLSLATTSVVYGLGVFVMVAVLPPEELRADLTPVASAMAVLDPLPNGIGVALIVVAAIAAFASTGNAGILSASRYPLAMARDKIVPAAFGSVGRSGTPRLAVVTTAVLMAVAIVFLPISDIAKLASAFQLLLFSLLSLAVVVMRESRIASYDPAYRSPFYPWMQVVGFVAPLWLIAEMGAMAILFTLGMVSVTVAWYLRWVAPRIERSGAIMHTMHRLGERRNAALDLELRRIAGEIGVREGDGFEDVVADAAVLDFDARVDWTTLVERASRRLAPGTGIHARVLREGFGHVPDLRRIPVDRGVALPHLCLPDVTRTSLLLVRVPEGISTPRVEDEETARKLRETRAAFFLVSPAGGAGRHLRILGQLATRAEDPDFVSSWLAARHALELKATLFSEERLVSLVVGWGRQTEAWIGRSLGSIDLPGRALVVLVRRDGRDLVPKGSTVLQADDRVWLIGDARAIRTLGGRETRAPAG